MLNFTCRYSSQLVQCVERSLSYLNTQCSKFQIEEAFRSQSTATFLSNHAPGLDLGVCFKVYEIDKFNTKNIPLLINVQKITGYNARLKFTCAVKESRKSADYNYNFFNDIQCIILQQSTQK